MLSFVSIPFSTQHQPLFVFQQFEVGSNNKRNKTKSCKHQSQGVYSLVKLTKI